jgi:acetoin utilization deacetylase AcuC-like enzyme
MVERARGSSGATLMACRTALLDGVSANIAGGTHHAYADRGGGFCVFNDTAVAARVIQLEHKRTSPHAFGISERLKIAVIDLDVHQGNGTAKIFSEDPTVFTLSVHGAKNFPFRKEVSDLDVELADGCGDHEYLMQLETALKTLESKITPDLIIYLAGADPYQGDRLGRLSLSVQGLKIRDQTVFDWAFKRRIPLAFSMAGGYAVPIDETVEINVNTFKLGYEYAQKFKRLTQPHTSASMAK